MITIKEKELKAFATLKDTFKYVNVLQAPRIQKVVVSVGIGSVKDKAKHEVIRDRLSKITGQKPAPRGAKQSIATYKLREGDTIGYQVTLRGERMRVFLDKFLNVALPRTRDFRGISNKIVDKMGNLTIGVVEHTIFPETVDEELKDVFGMSVTIVTSAKDRSEALKYFEYIGVPFKRDLE